MSLSDFANWAQIISVPVTVVAWLVSREKFARFWQRWLKWILFVVGFLAFFGIRRLGWLKWLHNQVTWPIWALILLTMSIPAAVTIILIAGSYFSSRLEQSDFLRYVSAEIFGIEWHWCWKHGQVDESSLSAFCPDKVCCCQLVAHIQKNRITETGEVSLVCNHCGIRKGFKSSWNRLVQDVAIEAERRCRTGEYKRELA